MIGLHRKFILLFLKYCSFLIKKLNLMNNSCHFKINEFHLLFFYLFSFAYCNIHSRNCS